MNMINCAEIKSDRVDAIDYYRTTCEHLRVAERMHDAVAGELSRAAEVASWADAGFYRPAMQRSCIEAYRGSVRDALASALNYIPAPGVEAARTDSAHVMLSIAVERITPHPIRCEYDLARINKLRDDVSAIMSYIVNHWTVERDTIKQFCGF